MKSLTFPAALLFYTLLYGLALTESTSTKWTYTTTPLHVTPVFDVVTASESSTDSGSSTFLQNDTTLAKCAGPYLLSVAERGRNKTFGNVTVIGQFIAGEMEHFCSSYARDMSACFKREKPNTKYYPDVLLYAVIDTFHLDSVVDFACPRIKAVSKHSACIVKYFTTEEKQNATLNCLNRLTSAFSSIEFSNHTLDELSAYFCSTWTQFAICMEPHLSSCSKDIGPIWLESVYRALGTTCKVKTKDLFPEYIRQIDAATSARATLSFILLCLIVALLH